MLSVVTLSVAMLSVVMLSVVMLSVVVLFLLSTGIKIPSCRIAHLYKKKTLIQICSF
jgi:hypothetical protein